MVTTFIKSVRIVEPTISLSSIPYSAGCLYLHRGGVYYDPVNGDISKRTTIAENSTVVDSETSQGIIEHLLLYTDADTGESRQFKLAMAHNAKGGFEGGEAATAENGGAALGKRTKSRFGVAAGEGSATVDGASLGVDAFSRHGGSAGASTISGDGFSGGLEAQVALDSHGDPIDAVQLGTGLNGEPKSVQAYNYKLMDSSGNIPKERIYAALAELGVVSATIITDEELVSSEETEE